MIDRIIVSVLIWLMMVDCGGKIDDKKAVEEAVKTGNFTKAELLLTNFL